ncbi:5-methyltetrahydropteroyltriglutamate--homocysteine methyltransferase-like isoform X2 [Branchiostoma floridae]|uniref:5-methyltetrahydropteroyltriglutamate-- homocysteine methyltransferase-like isoform X2 n=1 Tax=Branchiostoma floridae TaxID=7739 RepID=A0A9J7MZP6_BRAFL|nr:5-methyltetrahydropteroyltriglutamate--homocysteine methyltransferase-like isoform X2 [Branchiostoma floridae]
MPLQTTVIGSYPKPESVPVPDWFKAVAGIRKGQEGFSAQEYNDFRNDVTSTEELEKQITRAIREVIQEQVDIGIDVITDGELRRENYILYFCRQLNGFDFDNLVKETFRNGAWSGYVPAVVSEVGPRDDKPFVLEEWQAAQALTDHPVKITIPGPMTIIGSTANRFYKDRKELSEALVWVINREVRALADAGCKYIQIDEPVMMRNPEIAEDYGIEHVTRCFEGLPLDVTKTVHACCGYPSYLDQTDYMKADRTLYDRLATKLDNAGFDRISLEDAHCHTDLSFLSQFRRTTVVLGVVAIARSRVETVEEIRGRVREALRFLPPSRLVLAPDCGLGFLPRDVLRDKLKNLVAAAQTFPEN